jgi:hypothetical protein
VRAIDRLAYYRPAMSEQAGYSDQQLGSAIEALLDPERFRDAERRVARSAPQLQQVLAGALAEGGWFEPSHDQHVSEAAAMPDPEERLRALRTLLAEEARVGMMVGVAVGWELARELERQSEPGR